jgi:hypothetical protein
MSIDLVSVPDVGAWSWHTPWSIGVCNATGQYDVDHVDALVAQHFLQRVTSTAPAPLVAVPHLFATAVLDALGIPENAPRQRGGTPVIELSFAAILVGTDELSVLNLSPHVVLSFSEGRRTCLLDPFGGDLPHNSAVRGVDCSVNIQTCTVQRNEFAALLVTPYDKELLKEARMNAPRSTAEILALADEWGRSWAQHPASRLAAVRRL